MRRSGKTRLGVSQETKHLWVNLDSAGHPSELDKAEVAKCNRAESTIIVEHCLSSLYIFEDGIYCQFVCQYRRPPFSFYSLAIPEHCCCCLIISGMPLLRGSSSSAGYKTPVCQETRIPVTFFPYSPTTDTLFFLSLTTFPLHVLPNRLYSPVPLVFVAASSLT